MGLYPVNLNIENRLCIIIGGGRVAYRKAAGLLDAGAAVRVISPDLVDGLQHLVQENRLEWFSRLFAEGDLSGAFLVFAATDDREVQQRVADEAARYGVLLNSADDPAGCKFQVPAHFRRGDILVSVSTGGGSPALAKALREKLENVVVPEYEAVVELLSGIREKIVCLDIDSENHAEILRNMMQKGIVEAVLQENWFELQMILLSELPEQVDGVALLKKFLQKYDRS